MNTATFKLEATLKKKSLGPLAEHLKQIGFSRIIYPRGELTIEKQLEIDGSLDYQIRLGRDSITLVYSIDGKDKRKRFLSVMPVFLNILILSQSFYNLKSSPLFEEFKGFLDEMASHVGKDAVELTSELDELKAKHNDLSKKYAELVRSSEENARILLECERRRDELDKRVKQLEGLSDEALHQALFDWIKVHGGVLEISEFSKSYNLPSKRIREGLQALIEEGYIKRRSE